MKKLRSSFRTHNLTGPRNEIVCGMKRVFLPLPFPIMNELNDKQRIFAVTKISE